VHDKNGTFPLLMAAQNGHAAIVEALLTAGADAEREHSELGLSAVDVAVAAQQEDVIAVFARTLSLTEEALRSRSAPRLEKWRSKNKKPQ
jgi:ankyrin repeat protein